jgi:predicted  nucleic acid-binding Zn-ribbon protein
MAVRLLFAVLAVFILAAERPFASPAPEDYQRQIEELKNIIVNFSISVTSDIATMKADGEKAKEDMAAVKGTLEILRGSINGVKNDVNGIEDSVDDVAEEMEDVEDDVEDVEREMSHVKDELKDVEDDVEDVEDDVEDLEDNVDDVKDNVKDVKKCVEAMKEDTDIMKGAVEAIREDMGCVKEDMETLKNNLTAFWAELSRDTVELPSVEPCPVQPPTELPTGLPEPPVGTEQDYHCGGTSGWKRVTHFNMTNINHCCPTGWNETSYSNKRVCGRASAGQNTCDSAIFPVNGVEYSRVCGRAVGYQFGAVSAFFRSSLNIETHYVNGLGLTHGSAGNRAHIWTFAVGLSEGRTQYIREKCPCDGGTSPVPGFVGSDYFCESGLNGPWVDGQYIFYPEDQLWDGEDCLASSTCCSFNGPPYFIKEMETATTDDIEARLCGRYQQAQSDIAVEFLELYVQ